MRDVYFVILSESISSDIDAISLLVGFMLVEIFIIMTMYPLIDYVRMYCSDYEN